MYRIPPTVDALRASLPKSEATIERVHGIPDRLDLDRINDFLNDALTSFDSVKGGDMGHAAFNMDPVDYQALGYKKFILEPDPGELQHTQQWNPNLREDERLRHNQKEYTYELEKNVQTFGKQFVMSKLPETTYLGLRHVQFKYRKVTIYDLNQHLIMAYGEKTAEMLLNNESTMQEPYDCSGASLANLFYRQNVCQLFAVNETIEIPDGRWIAWTLKVIKDSGLFYKSCKKWEAQPAAFKTKAMFITEFNKYHKEYIKKRNTEGGISSASSVQVEALQRQVTEQAEATAEQRRTSQVQTAKINEIIDSQTIRDDQASLAGSIPRNINTTATAQDDKISRLETMMEGLMGQIQ